MELEGVVDEEAIAELDAAIYNKMYFQWRKNSSLKVQFFVTKDL